MKHVIAALLVWPFATALGGWLMLHTGPAMETRIAPVLTDQRVEQVARSDGRVCWVWSYLKVRPATPQTIAWSFTVNGTSLRVPAVVLRAGERSPLVAHRTLPAGPGRIELCAVIPDDLDGVKGLSISGAIEYEPQHSFWTIWHSIPSIGVPVLPGSPIPGEKTDRRP